MLLSIKCRCTTRCVCVHFVCPASVCIECCICRVITLTYLLSANCRPESLYVCIQCVCPASGYRVSCVSCVRPMHIALRHTSLCITACVYTSCVQRVWAQSVMGVVCIVWAVYVVCEHPSILLYVKLLSVKCRPVSLCVWCVHTLCVCPASGYGCVCLDRRCCPRRCKGMHDIASQEESRRSELMSVSLSNLAPYLRACVSLSLSLSLSRTRARALSLSLSLVDARAFTILFLKKSLDTLNQRLSLCQI